MEKWRRPRRPAATGTVWRRSSTAKEAHKISFMARQNEVYEGLIRGLLYRVHASNGLPLYLTVDELTREAQSWSMSVKDLIETRVPGGAEKLVYNLRVRNLKAAPGVYRVVLKTDQGDLPSNRLRVSVSPDKRVSVEDLGWDRESSAAADEAARYEAMSLRESAGRGQPRPQGPRARHPPGLPGDPERLPQRHEPRPGRRGAHDPPRAFIYAGAPSVLASLWSVNDAATARLMADFYAGIKSGKDKAESLRQAQLKLMQDPRYKHPYYWGAFVLIGDYL